MRSHGLRTLTSPPQPRGIVENARLAGITVHFQSISISDGQMQFPGRAVPVESGGLGERGWAVARQGVGSWASGVAQGAGSQTLAIRRLVSQTARS